MWPRQERWLWTLGGREPVFTPCSLCVGVEGYKYLGVHQRGCSNRARDTNKLIRKTFRAGGETAADQTAKHHREHLTSAQQPAGQTAKQLWQLCLSIMSDPILLYPAEPSRSVPFPNCVFSVYIHWIYWKCIISYHTDKCCNKQLFSVSINHFNKVIMS